MGRRFFLCWLLCGWCGGWQDVSKCQLAVCAAALEAYFPTHAFAAKLVLFAHPAHLLLCICFAAAGPVWCLALAARGPAPRRLPAAAALPQSAHASVLPNGGRLLATVPLHRRPIASGSTPLRLLSKRHAQKRLCQQTVAPFGSAAQQVSLPSSAFVQRSRAPATAGPAVTQAAGRQASARFCYWKAPLANGDACRSRRGSAAAALRAVSRSSGWGRCSPSMGPGRGRSGRPAGAVRGGGGGCGVAGLWCGARMRRQCLPRFGCWHVQLVQDSRAGGPRRGIRNGGSLG